MTIACSPIGAIVLECTSCPNTLDTETNVWVSAWSEAKNAGWAAKREAEYWQHHCPRCAGSIGEANETHG